MQWHTKSNSGVTAELTPVCTTLLLKQTSQTEYDLLCQAIPLSAPGTPDCLMPVETTVPGLSLYDCGSDTLLVSPFALWIYYKTTQFAPSNNKRIPLQSVNLHSLLNTGWVAAHSADAAGRNREIIVFSVSVLLLYSFKLPLCTINLV